MILHGTIAMIKNNEMNFLFLIIDLKINFYGVPSSHC